MSVVRTLGCPSGSALSKCELLLATKGKPAIPSVKGSDFSKEKIKQSSSLGIASTSFEIKFNQVPYDQELLQ